MAKLEAHRRKALPAAKLAEREERVRRAGQSRYLVEPNVKDGKGGLRDLHTLFWIAKYVYRVRDTSELLDRGVFDPAEFRTFRRCEDFLWSVRCNIHFVSKRPEERLSFDLQREIGVRLGYTSHPGMQDVERFMKHYFLIAKEVGNLTAILCAKLEDQQTKAAPALTRMMARLRPAAKRRRVPESDDFVIDNNRINLAVPDVFKHDPVNLIRIFRLAQKNNLAFHPDAMRTVTRSLGLINAQLRDNPEANRVFIEILTSDNAEPVLRRMNETGVLGRFIRAFGRIVSMMQFNMYHSYTVDEHLIRCVGNLQEIERGGNDEFALSSELMRKIRPDHRAVLYVAVLLHDIAKGQPEDHSTAGAKVARRLCPRFGFSAADTELVAWLIEQHLVMSTVAQSRDLSDRKTIENFAAVVESVEQMKLLTILTTADIRGVGPGLGLVVILVAARAAGVAARLLGQPTVVGEILADLAIEGSTRHPIDLFVHRGQQPRDGARLLLVEDVQRPCAVLAGTPGEQDRHRPNTSGWRTRANVSVTCARRGPGDTSSPP